MSFVGRVTKIEGSPWDGPGCTKPGGTCQLPSRTPIHVWFAVEEVFQGELPRDVRVLIPYSTGLDFALFERYAVNATLTRTDCKARSCLRTGALASDVIFARTREVDRETRRMYRRLRRDVSRCERTDWPNTPPFLVRVAPVRRPP